MDELAMLREKLADLESKLEDANQRKMPSVTNEWIVTECRKSVNKIERDEQLFLDTHKVLLAAAEERIMNCNLIIPPNESIMTPLSRAIMADPKGPWRVQYQLWDGGNSGIALPPSKPDDNGVTQRHRVDFVKKMVKKHHSEMLKKTFPTATSWEGGAGAPLWVTFPNPVDPTDTLLS